MGPANAERCFTDEASAYWAAHVWNEEKAARLRREESTALNRSEEQLRRYREILASRLPVNCCEYPPCELFCDDVEKVLDGWKCSV